MSSGWLITVASKALTPASKSVFTTTNHQNLICKPKLVSPSKPICRLVPELSLGSTFKAPFWHCAMHMVFAVQD